MCENLSKLQQGDRAIILKLENGTSNYRQQLLALGVVPGIICKVIMISPLGDPIQIQLENGTRVSVRKDECQIVKVKKL